jgi:hypothetical protein
VAGRRPSEPDSGPVEPVLLQTLTIFAGRMTPSSRRRPPGRVELPAGRNRGGRGARRRLDGDADYYWADDLPDITRGDSAGGVDLGLAINDTTIDNNRSPDWGSYTDSHVYETTMAGTGATLTAQFHDPEYSNNSGSLSLEIWGPPDGWGGRSDMRCVAACVVLLSVGCLSSPPGAIESPRRGATGR